MSLRVNLYLFEALNEAIVSPLFVVLEVHA
jgi:hypothetical protein